MKNKPFYLENIFNTLSKINFYVGIILILLDLLKQNGFKSFLILLVSWLIGYLGHLYKEKHQKSNAIVYLCVIATIALSLYDHPADDDPYSAIEPVQSLQQPYSYEDGGMLYQGYSIEGDHGMMEGYYKGFTAAISKGIFEYQEYNYSDLYQKDMAFMELVILFSLIAILIGGMGIFAFAIFMVESKTREIALRKVNGASERQIMLLFNRQFMTKVLVACVIGLPIAYYASRKWLENYAYRIEIQPWIFVLTIVISLCIVLLVTNWQIRQASRKNPIDTLKTE